MDDEASDDNDLLYDDFGEDDDIENDEADKKFKIPDEEVKHSSDRKDGHSHLHKDKDGTLSFDPSQDVDRHEQDVKRKEDKRPDDLKEKKDGSVGVEGAGSGSLQKQSPSMDTSYNGIGVNSEYSQTSNFILDESTHVSRTSVNKVTGQEKHVSVLKTRSQIPGHETKERTVHVRQPYVTIPFEGAVVRRSSDSIIQPGAQSSLSQPSGEINRIQEAKIFNVVGSKGVHINEEQSELRLERDLKMKVFVRTEKIKECKKILKKWGVLLLKGGPGEGKTTAGLYLLKIMSNSRRPLILTDPHQWDHLSTQKKTKYVILIDDTFGRTNLVDDLKTRWEQKFPMMNPMIEAGTVCVIVTLRTNIYLQCKEQFKAIELFRRCTTVDLSSDDLSEDERLEMLDLHMALNSRNACLSDDEKRNVVQGKDLVPFPLCCYLFTSNMRGHYNIVDFRKSLKYLTDAVLSIQRYHPDDFFVLLLVMFYDNHLPKRVFDVLQQSSEDKEILAKLSQVCTVRPVVDSLMNAAESLCQTFLIFDTDSDCFLFKHNSIEDALFMAFCEDHFAEALEMCSTRMLLEYVRTDQGLRQEIAVFVSKKDFDKLAARLIKDMLSPNKALVLTHQAFKDLDFLRYMDGSLNADIREEIAVFKGEIQSYGVHQYLTDTTINFLMNKCLHQPTMHHTFHRQYVNVLSIDSIPACLVLNGADRFAIRLLKGMKDCEVFFSCHANKTLACAFYMSSQELAIELIELGAEITFDCFKAVCVAPSINENLVEFAAGVISQEHPDCLLNLLTQSLELGHFECIKLLVLSMARDKRFVQLEEFCRRLLIICHNTKPSWIPVSLEQTKFFEILELLNNMGVNCYTDCCVLLAVGCHDIQILKYLVKCGGNIHCRDERGQSPLHLASLYGSRDTVMYLINQSVDKHARDNDGYTPLHRAAQSSTESCDKVVHLADENAQLMLNSGESVLDISIRKGDIKTVQYLCRQFADRGSQLGQPLYVAVTELAQMVSQPESAENTFKEKWTQNRYHIIGCLIESGFSLSYVDDSVVSSLAVITERGNKDVFQAIIASCDMYTLCKLLQVAKQLNLSILLAELNLYVQSRLGNTAVKDTTSNNLSHSACKVKVKYGLKYLVQREKNENKKVCHSRTFLHRACENGDIALVESLVQAGAKVNVIDRDEKTPSHYACAQNDAAFVKCLVQKGPKVNVTDKFMKTPLHYACEHGNIAVVQCLIQRGAKLNVKDTFQKTPLQYACVRGDTAMVQCLLRVGGKVTSADCNFKTPLHYACLHGDTAMVECIIRESAEWKKRNKYREFPQRSRAMVDADWFLLPGVNERDKNGKTPLHYACEHGNTAMVESLIQGGAVVNLSDGYGKTPIRYAQERCDYAMVEILQTKLK